MSDNKLIREQFLNLYQMAISDSKFDVEELAQLYRIGEEKGISPEELEEIIIHPISNGLFIPETLSAKLESLYDLAKIAQADNKIDESEIRMLKKCCSSYGFLEENISEIVNFLLDEASKGTPFLEVLNIVNKNL